MDRQVPVGGSAITSRQVVMRDNRVKAALKRGDVVCGVGLTIMAPGLVELIGLAGFDFVILDEQHGWMNPESAAHLVRAAETVDVTPMVRVPETQASIVGKFLDLGVQGIVFPNVSSADEARLAMDAVRYEPQGRRGSCPTVRAADYSLSSWTEHYEKSNRDIFTLVLVETREGFDNLERILEVEGIDAVLLGPFDLASSLGVPGQVKHSKVVQRVEHAKGVVRQAGVTLCAWDMEVESLVRAREEGVRMFWLSGTKMFADTLRESAARIRRAVGSGAVRGD